MADLGHFFLCLSWLLALLGMIAGAYAGFRKHQGWFGTARQATVLTSWTAAVATVALGYAFLTNDYSIQYVWQFSNRDMQDVYKISAIWGGMDGSMLLWAFILSVSAGIVAWGADNGPRRLMPWVLSVANSSTLFFLTIVVFVTNPFRYIKAPFIPPDGNGLNPLLQNPLMAIHPPTLYLGFTIFAIPYAFCIAALLAGELSNDWIRITRRWALTAWMFLTAGIVLGGHWAYVELGWGGFWAWDPVENSSFLPWLTGTAFLHSVMVQERKGLLKLWNVWLVVATYALTVFGTFLTRSGVVQSVHSFASTDVGWVFLLYLGMIISGALALSIYRRRELRPDRSIESFLSREAMFLVNNLLLLSICFATFWGVMFPVFSEAITGQKQAVGIPFFNIVNVPLFLLLILALGIGPLIAWRKTSVSQLRRLFVVPALCGVTAGALLLWGGIVEFYPVLSYSLCVFVAAGIFGELHRGIAQQRLGGADTDSFGKRTARLIRRHHVRYGSHVVHLGVIIATIGITASMAHKIEKEFSLAPGEQYQVGRFALELESIKDLSTPNYDGLVTHVKVLDRWSGEQLGSLAPELRRYRRNSETTTEVAVRTSLREDVYLVIAGLDDTGTRAAMKLYINPLQIWLWFGSIIMILGTLVVLVPMRRAVAVEQSTAAEARV